MKKKSINSRLFTFIYDQNQEKFKNQVYELTHKYYSEENNANFYSKETSSHWQKYGELQRASVTEGILKLSGLGFGDYEVRYKSVLRKLMNLPYLVLLNFRSMFLPKSLRKGWRRIAKVTNRSQSADFVRIARSVKILAQKLDSDAFAKVVIIGDGFGTTGQIIKEIFPKSSITFINLGRALVFDAAFTHCAFPNATHLLLKESFQDQSTADFNYIEAEELEKISCDGTLFINIASMQEMNQEVIIRYLELIRSQQEKTYFYCANRESKILPDGREIKFSEYGWSETDVVLFNSSPIWLQWILTRRPPFIRKLDGRILHKLIRIN